MHFVIYTNILTPYRKYFYDLLYKTCMELGNQFHVLVMAETEPDRPWKYEALKGDYTILLKNKMISKGGTYIHINSDLMSTLKELKPNVVVCAGSYLCPGVWKIARSKDRLNCKVIYWSESHLNEIKKSSAAKRFVREFLRNRVYKLFDGFWYAGKLSREFEEKYAAPDATYHFLPNLIEEAKYSVDASLEERRILRQKFKVPEDKTMFICPARLIPVKGILEFLDLLKECPSKEKAAVMIAGSGELKTAIEHKAAENGLDVRLVGQKTQDEIIELYIAADVFLLPSLSDPNPLTCVEALWAKKPLLISEHCGNYPETVRPGENGYVFSYSDKEAAVKYIELMINADASWKNKAGCVSGEIAQDIYASVGVTKRIVEEMEQIC